MNKLYKIATASALVMLSANAVSSSVATGYFQWAGETPPTNVSSTIKIINTGDLNHLNGALILEEVTDGFYGISGASDLSFNVVVVDETVETVVNYSYEVTSIVFSAGVPIMNEDYKELFHVTANGMELVKNDISPVTSGSTTLSLTSVEAGFEAEPSDLVTVQATVLVTGDY